MLMCFSEQDVLSIIWANVQNQFHCLFKLGVKVITFVIISVMSIKKRTIF